MRVLRLSRSACCVLLVPWFAMVSCATGDSGKREILEVDDGAAVCDLRAPLPSYVSREATSAPT